MEDSTVTYNQSQEIKDEYITIDDEEDLDESNVGLAIVTDDEDEKESDGELIILQPLSPSPKPSPVPSPVPSQAASPTTAMGPASPDPEIESETLEGDTVILRLDTNSDVISIDDVDDMTKEKESIATVPFKGFYKDILSSDSEKLQNKEDLPSHQASKSILENLHYVSSLTDDSIAESGTTTEHSTPEKNDDTVNDAVTKNEEFWRNLEKLQKAKRQKLKKNKEMQGYRSRKRTKRGKKMKDATSDQNDLESVGSEFSSEFSGMDKSSIVDGSNLSGRGSPSVEVLEDKVRVSGPMSLEDFGLSHWREAENDQRFQPVVHLEMLPDDMARTIIVKDVREENLIPFDTEDALPKQERVQAWIERFANKKKIKLTLKNMRKNIPDEGGSRIPVIGQKSVSLGQEKSITNRSSSETATKIPTVLSSSSTTTTISITTVSAVSQQTSTTISHLPTTNTSVVTQPSHPTTAVMYYQAKPGPPLYYQSQTPVPAPCSHIVSQPGYVQHQAVHTLPVRPFVARHQVPPVQHIPRVHVPAVPVQPVIPVPRVPLIVPPPSMPVPPPGQVRPLVSAMPTVVTAPASYTQTTCASSTSCDVHRSQP
ncbi:hypothetical protein FSP39_002720 [Pinctada imbricata]|uniref:Uncharacterized protein n=1 Tax=Pinctada imbricata TaxID=66713 RepID=A0AA89C0A1_PINIB|nr:hypothetical protein FSP39_002720 [Pinctada imbricata]